MPKRNPPRRASLAAVLLPFLSFATAASAQTLVTDKSDYLPGESVYFAGSGFQPGEGMAIAIHVETTTEKVIDYAIGAITVDAAGEFTATWLVPGEALNSVITATAMGLTSRRVAEATFRDGHLAVVGSHHLTHIGTIPGGELVKLEALVFRLTDCEYSVDALGRVTQAGNLLGEFGARMAQESPGSLVMSTAIVVPCQSTVEFDFVRISVSCHSGNGPFFEMEAYLPPFEIPELTVPPCTPCPGNTPPIISCEDLNLGDLVGCLADGLTKSVTVSATDFTCTVSDPDGDPVSLTLLGPSSLNLVGPGMAEATVTFSATDDPSGRQASSGSCSPLVPQTTTQTATVRARIVYDFEGPLAPLEPGVTVLKKVGREVPINFRLRDCAGTALCPSNFAPLASNATKPRLEVQVVTVLSPGGEAPLEEPGSFACFPNQLVGFEGTCDSGHWSYNLSTKDGNWTAGLTYRANVVLGDGTVHSVFFSLKK